MLYYAPGLSKKIKHKIPFLCFLKIKNQDYTRLHNVEAS